MAHFRMSEEATPIEVDVEQLAEQAEGAVVDTSKAQDTLTKVRGSYEQILQPYLQKLPHANIITGRIRTALAGIGLLLYPVSPISSAVSYSANLVGDGLDGAVARAKDQRTVAGERLDPLVDKLTNSSYLAMLAVLHSDNPMYAMSALLMIGVDLASQVQRGDIRHQIQEAIAVIKDPEDTELVDTSKDSTNSVAANWYGKAKMAVASTSIVAMTAAGDQESVQIASTAGLVGASILGTRGVVQRILKGGRKSIVEHKALFELSISSVPDGVDEHDKTIYRRERLTKEELLTFMNDSFRAFGKFHEPGKLKKLISLGFVTDFHRQKYSEISMSQLEEVIQSLVVQDKIYVDGDYVCLGQSPEEQNSTT